MRIAMCTWYSPYAYSGAVETLVREISEILVKKHGHEVFYIANKGYGARQQARDNISFFRATPLPPLLNTLKPLVKMIDNGLLLEKFVKRYEIDLLHIHYPPVASSVAFVRMHKIPVVVTMHLFPPIKPPEFTSKTFAYQAVEKLAFSWGIKNVDTITCPSKYMAKLLYDNFGVKSHVIPNAVHVKKIADIPSKHEAKKTFNLRKSIITFVGRLSPQKGLKYLLEAFSILHSKVEARLFIAGRGPSERHLKLLSSKLGLEQNVKFLGYVSERLKYSLLAATDVFVCPSIYEPFGIVNLEALAAGLPIVASRAGGIPEIVEDGVNGYLVPPREPQALADAVLKLLKDERLRIQIRENNLEKAKMYDWNMIFPKIYEVYKNAF